MTEITEALRAARWDGARLEQKPLPIKAAEHGDKSIADVLIYNFLVGQPR
jgi:hypothetical protein